ncbi:unnamed protein product [Rangifer tarandus platyrhynchus]|uniref:Uncharacterized protein n=2 Tax=Rangifer tarandus platyrhynchus TaxID=3082113 RepID=A0ABN8YUL8_RANTA|nr:unnamed protein product [Rangifer tarandus platyrhynchus]CAI9701740.1 unnamed protein product [Rangifer tarandus platyrhynchus]
MGKRKVTQPRTSATLLLELNTLAAPSVESSLHNPHLGGQGSRLTSQWRQRLCTLPFGEAADGKGAQRWCRSSQSRRARTTETRTSPAPGTPSVACWMPRRFSRISLASGLSERTPKRGETPTLLPGTQPRKPSFPGKTKVQATHRQSDTATLTQGIPALGLGFSRGGPYPELRARPARHQ